MIAAAALGITASTAHGQPARSSRSTPRLTLKASFTPERLGAATAIGFSMRVDPAAGDPLPVSAVQVSYPLDFGLATSGLGEETCEPTALEQSGPRACPANSLMGHGSAVVQVNFGPELVTETISLTMYAAPSNNGYIHLAILAQGEEPVLASLVLPGVLYPGRLAITVPAIETLPGAPNAALISMHATLGGNLTYYEHSHGRTIAYHPRGIGLPDSCPRHGFKLAANINFTDGQSSQAAAAVPCPRGRR